MSGLISSTTIDQTDALRSLMATSDDIDLGDLDVYAPGITQTEVANKVFFGTGELTGIYRKFTIQPNADGPAPPAVTLIPGRHVPSLSKMAPVVVLVGDSISTYLANQTGRQDMLAYILEQEVKRQIPDAVFYDRSLPGAPVVGFNTTPSTPAPVGVPWWPDGASWISCVLSLSPDVIVLSFGMNDTGTLEPEAYDNLRTALNGSGFKGQIVLCTNMVPSLGCIGNEENATPETQRGRDEAAGVTRSYALFHNLGLLDFHRQFCKVRDGFDPAASSLSASPMPVDYTSGQCTGQQEVTDFLVDITIPAGGLPVASYIGIKTGSHASDMLYLTQNGAGRFHVDLYAGNTAVSFGGSDTTTPVPSTEIRLIVEVKQDTVTLYDPASGSDGVAIFQSRIIRAGGSFLPVVSLPSATYAEPQVYAARAFRNKPTLRDRDLFHDAGFAGTNFNHPGNFTGAYIYQPVFNLVSWVGAYAGGIGAFSSSGSPPTPSHVLGVKSGQCNHVRLEDESGNAWAFEMVAGNLRFRRITGTGTLDLGGGTGVSMFGKPILQGGPNSAGAGYRLLAVTN